MPDLPEAPLFSPRDWADIALAAIAFILATAFNLLWADWRGKAQAGRWRKAMQYGIFAATVMGVWLANTDKPVGAGWIIGFCGAIAMIDRKDLRNFAKSLMAGIGKNLVDLGSKLFDWGARDD